MARIDCLSMILDDDIAERDNFGWRVEPATPDPANPLIEPEMPWDQGAVFAHGTFLKDPTDGLWKGWHVCTPSEGRNFEAYRRLCYSESEDGVNWTRPELDLNSYEGHPKTNIIFDFDSGGSSQYASVIVHPDAEPDQRYEMFIIRAPSRRPQNLGSGWIPGLPREPGADSHPYATYRYRSPDGIHWTAVEGPLLRIMAVGDRLIMPYTTPMGGADQASYYLLEDGTYELMQKVGTEMHPGGYVPYDCFFPYGRRVLARRTSPDGSNWTPPEVIVEPDWKDPHDQQFMELMPHTVRGGYIGLLCCYNVREQTIDWQWAGSQDRRIWNRPSRRPTLPNAPLGDYGGGMLWPTHQLIEDGDRIYMYYSGLEGVHGDVYSIEPSLKTFYGAICRASWEKDRYWAAVSATGGPEPAVFTTNVLSVGGKRLALNAATSTVKEGELTAELVDASGNVIEGFSASDYQPWHGDSKSQPVRWTGGDVCPVDNAAVRFSLQRSRLYGFAFE